MTAESAAGTRVRKGATLITFYELAYWGLDPALDYGGWIDAVYENPRHYFDRMLDGMAESGVEGIELSPTPGGWEGAIKAYGSAAALGRELADRRLVLGTSYQNGGTLIGDALDDPAAEAAADAYTDAHARFISELGADIIVMGTVPRAPFSGGDYDAEVPAEATERVAAQVDRMGRVASRHGVRLALHTDAYSVCGRNSDIASMMAATDAANVGLCLDAGHTALDGGDPVAALHDHVDRVPVMHWKDCVHPLDGSTLPGDQMQRHEIMLKNFRIFGAGTIDWVAWQRVLRDADWSGWAMAENDMSPDPIGEIEQGLRFFDRELREIHS